MKAVRTYHISGLTCSNCVAKVRTALLPFADTVEISLKPPHISLSQPTVSIEALNATLKNLGNYQIGAEVIETTATIAMQNHVAIAPASLVTYQPLILVFAYILLVTLAIEAASGALHWHRFMPNFMAGFFLVFSFFKMLDLTGFANSYAMYDLLAKKWCAYGFIYPFIELGLGVAYLLAYRPMLINALTLIVMLFSSIGVILTVANKQKIRCACLGTGFNLPMTTVTIIEDFLMAAMAAWMLI